MNSSNQLNSTNFEKIFMYSFINFLWKVMTPIPRKKNQFVLVNIIHGYLISLFIHRATLSMDTNSNYSIKVTHLIR